MKETQSQFKKYVGWSVLIQSILSGALAGVLYFHSGEKGKAFIVGCIMWASCIVAGRLNRIQN